MGVYVEAFYHFVWATRRREAFITDVVERELYRYMEGKCRDMKIPVHALNGMPDHVHFVVSLPPRLAPADFMETIKGASSHYINHRPDQMSPLFPLLYWQPGYGMLTLDERRLPVVIRYVERQKQRHGAGRLSQKMERMTDWEVERPASGTMS